MLYMWHITYIYSKDNFFKISINFFEKYVSCNMLCIRKDETVKIDLPEVKDSSLHPLRSASQ